MGKRKTGEANAVEATSKKRRRDEVDADNFETVDTVQAEKKRLKKEKKVKKKAEETAIETRSGADGEEQKKEKKDKKKSKREGKIKSEEAAVDGHGDEAKPKKKRKRDAEDEIEAVAEGQAVTAAVEKPEKKKKKKNNNNKKSKDGKKDKKSSKLGEDHKAPVETTNGDDAAQPDGQDVEPKGDEGQAAGKNARFIVFVGNLPFTATKEVVAEHFASLKPTSVRLLSEKNDPKKSRGIAFVEFDNYSHMKTCLAKMHHSEFEDGESAPRKINVELTAGGGGKTPFRKEKIKAKNEKLREERTRKMKAEIEAKHKEDEQDGIHPSRRAQMYRQQ